MISEKFWYSNNDEDQLTNSRENRGERDAGKAREGSSHSRDSGRRETDIDEKKRNEIGGLSSASLDWKLSCRVGIATDVICTIRVTNQPTFW